MLTKEQWYCLLGAATNGSIGHKQRAAIQAAIAERKTLIGLLGRVLPHLCETAEGESYGSPIGIANPHDFTPDRQCCSPEEIAAWEAACEAYDRGEQVEIPHHRWLVGAAEDAEQMATLEPGDSARSVYRAADGKIVAHVAHEPWGIGTSRWRDDGVCALRDEIQAALAEGE